GLIWTVVSILIINLVFFIFEIGVSQLWIHVLILSFISTLHAFHCVILLAKQKMQWYNFFIFFQPLLLLVALCLSVFVFDIQNVNAYIIAQYISCCSAFILSGIQVLKLLKSQKQKEAVVNWRDIIKNGFTNELGNLAHTLSNRYSYYILEAI